MALIQKAIDTNTDAPELGKLVNPSTDPRYGVKLYRWLTLGREKGRCRIFRDSRGNRYIGHLDHEADGGSAMVANLADVTVRGNQAVSFPFRAENIRHWQWQEITNDFWRAYVQDGMEAFPELPWR